MTIRVETPYLLSNRFRRGDNVQFMRIQRWVDYSHVRVTPGKYVYVPNNTCYNCSFSLLDNKVLAYVNFFDLSSTIFSRGSTANLFFRPDLGGKLWLLRGNVSLEGKTISASFFTHISPCPVKHYSMGGD